MLQIKQYILLSLFFILSVFSLPAEEIDNITFKDYLISPPILRSAIKIKSEISDDPLNEIIELYNNKRYRLTILKLKNILEINIPDSRLDTYIFMMGECYHQLDLDKMANNYYRLLLKEHKKSEFISWSYYRLLESAYEKYYPEFVTEYYRKLEKDHKKSEVFIPALFIYGKALYRIPNRRKSDSILTLIPKEHDLYESSLLIRSLNAYHLGLLKKSLFCIAPILESNKTDLKEEARFIQSRIYADLDRDSMAIVAIDKISKTSTKTYRAKLKKAKYLNKLGKTQEAIITAQKLLNAEDANYIFEAALILEEIYKGLPDGKRRIQVIKEYIELITRRKRIIFDIYTEIEIISDSLTKATDLYRNKMNVLINPIKKRKTENIFNEISYKYNKLIDKNKSFLRKYDPKNTISTSSGFKNLRYIEIVNSQISDLKRNADSVSEAIALLEARDPGSAVSQLRGLRERFEYVSKEVADKTELREDIKQLLLGEVSISKQAQDMQAKYIDWLYMRYYALKEDRIKTARLIINTPKDSTKKNNLDSLTTLVADIEKQLPIERSYLVENLNMLLKSSPMGLYNDKFLFRLSELYYEQAFALSDTMSEDSDEEIKVDMRKTFALYQKIIKGYPDSDIADDVLFFLATSYLEQDMPEKANSVFNILVNHYPSTEYYVEGMMQIGSYYFNHPKIQNGKGYQLAINSYKKVLKYRDHNSFMEATYRLAWCYYMQDQFGEAVTVFRYLIEYLDQKLMEDTEGKKELYKLFREEALNYIAFSLCEENDIKKSISFLGLLGSKRYSSLILNLMGNYYLEQLDYDLANSAFRAAVKKYPKVETALDAHFGIIKVYDAQDSIVEALKSKVDFYSRYSNVGLWQKGIRNKKVKDRANIECIKQALSCGHIKVSRGKEKQDISIIKDGFKSYDFLIKNYPKSPGAFEARMIKAEVYEDNLKDYNAAIDIYLSVSNGTNKNLKRTAAQNAIAVSQKIEETEEKDSLGLSYRDKKIIQTTSNFLKIFPKDSLYTQITGIKAAIYFNRNLLKEASDLYREIAKKVVSDSSREKLQAFQFLGQCYSGLEKFEKAEKVFQKVFNIALLPAEKVDAKKRMMENAYKSGERLRTQKKYLQAKQKFLVMEQKYAESEILDRIIYLAAMSAEDDSSYSEAAIIYKRVFDKVRGSESAKQALFDAAGCYEKDFVKLKDSAWIKAIKMYQLVVDNYPFDELAKKSLNFISVAYSKLKMYDKVAETYELFAKKYPGEKGIEQRLFLSGQQYLLAKKLPNALIAFRNFIEKFPASNQEIEARYEVAKILTKMNKLDESEDELARLVVRNGELTSMGKGDAFIAAEASFTIAEIYRERLFTIKLKMPKDVYAISYKRKMELLKKTREAFENVIRYKSERLLEAQYWIGRIFHDYAMTIYKQERDTTIVGDKAAIFENRTAISSSKFILSAINMYNKVFEYQEILGKEAVKPEQQKYVKNAQMEIYNCRLTVGEMYEMAGRAFLRVQPPAALKSNPLQYYLYKTMVLPQSMPYIQKSIVYGAETVYTLKESIKKDSLLILKAENNIARALFIKGEAVYRLSKEIENNSEAPEDMDEDEADDMIFAMEDIADSLNEVSFEMFEEILENFEELEIKNKWKISLLKRLKELDPETYTPAEDYGYYYLRTGEKWFVRNTYDTSFMDLAIPKKGSGWTKYKFGNFPEDMNLWKSFNGATPIWTEMPSEKCIAKRLFFLQGKPVKAVMKITAKDDFQLFVNGMKIVADSIGPDDYLNIDTVDILKYLKAGDNAISFLMKTYDTLNAGLLVDMEVKMDTTIHSTSKLGLSILSNKKNGDFDPNNLEEKPSIISSKDTNAMPIDSLKQEDDSLKIKNDIDTTIKTEVKKEKKQVTKNKIDSTKIKPIIESTTTKDLKKDTQNIKSKVKESKKDTQNIKPKVKESKKDTQNTKPKVKETEIDTRTIEEKKYDKEFKNFEEFKQATAIFEKRNKILNNQIKEKKRHNKKIKFKISAIDEKIKSTKDEIKRLKKSINLKNRSK